MGAFPILYYAECAPQPRIIKLTEHKPYASHFNVSPSTNVSLCTVKTSLCSKRRAKCAKVAGKLLGRRCVFNSSLPPSACHLCLLWQPLRHTSYLDAGSRSGSGVTCKMGTLAFSCLETRSSLFSRVSFSNSSPPVSLNSQKDVFHQL